MATAKYNSVSQTTSTFGNPRQKTWIVMKMGLNGWSLIQTTTSFTEAQKAVKDYMSAGGQYGNINNIMVAEVVPIDIMVTPQV